MTTKRISTLARVAALALALLAVGMPRTAGAAEPADVRFSISDNVSDEDEAYVREGISLAEDYVRENLGGEIDDDLSVNVRATADPDDPYILAFAAGDFLVVYTGSPAWETLAPALRIQTVIHEYIHIYQGDMLGNGADASPMWLIEGMAEYLAYDAIVELGIVDQEEVDDYNAWAVLYSGYRVEALDQIEAIWDFQAAEGPVYPLSYLAVRELVGELPSRALEEYLATVDNGEDWRDAFPDAFGVELDAFYGEFTDWIGRELDAPARIPGAFREVFPEELAAAVTILSDPAQIVAGDQAVVLAETERGSLCNFTLRDEDGQRMATLDTFADRDGMVFWLVTIPASAVAGLSEVMVDCGDQRDRVKLQIVETPDGTWIVQDQRP